MHAIGNVMLLGLTVAGRRRISEFADLIGGLGAIFLVVQGLMLYRNPSARENRGIVTMIAGLLIGVAFLLMIISQHF